MGFRLDPLGMEQQGAARLGQARAAGRSIHQARAQPAFQPVEPARHGGMVQPQRAGGRGQPAMAGHFQKDPQIIPLANAHGVPANLHSLFGENASIRIFAHGIQAGIPFPLESLPCARSTIS
jgi:hypothetical protein